MAQFQKKKRSYEFIQNKTMVSSTSPTEPVYSNAARGRPRPPQSHCAAEADYVNYEVILSLNQLQAAKRASDSPRSCFTFWNNITF